MTYGETPHVPAPGMQDELRERAIRRELQHLEHRG